MSTKQIPMKNGVGASCVVISALPVADMTVLDYFSQRFEHVSLAQWQQRFEQGEVVDAQAQAILPNALLADFLTQKIFYYRHVPNEVAIPFEASIVYENEHIVVADKPHFLPVMPGGQYLHETLLVRLRMQLNYPDLTPVHRIDRETAGLVLLVKNASVRGAYQALFRERLVEKQYEAIAKWRPEYHFPFEHASRLAENGDFFRMAEVEGMANATTILDVLQHNDEWAHYVLKPITGKRHQLRVHMAALGMPILNDGFYPQAKPMSMQDYAQPLQLLAKKMAFIDPVTQEKFDFYSQLSLWNIHEIYLT
ncbi:pseudouridine synthase [Vitreoscilla stercoraria]|uniref:Pseudouridine synthase n=2 Tax=Vitreoscilla stercoraria TaxID=61 RepID=A0ABY4E8S5_VITST|nr:pseudouridine synthase [Vitreoscilla stercoraria]UOO92154.1 pseudouridine synthase [Vitreoscilla stercoraria]